MPAMHRSAVFLLLSISVTRVAPARSLQLEDYYRIESASAPAISPDGRWVVFVRNSIIEAENERHTEIWMSPSDGSTPPVRLTNPAFSASAPQWSPDGKLLAFHSTRKAPGIDGDIWFLRMDQAGGEALVTRAGCADCQSDCQSARGLATVTNLPHILKLTHYLAATGGGHLPDRRGRVRYDRDGMVSLEDFVADSLIQLPVTEDTNITLDPQNCTLAPAETETERLKISKTYHDYEDAVRYDAIHFFADKQTYRASLGEALGTGCFAWDCTDQRKGWLRDRARPCGQGHRARIR